MTGGFYFNIYFVRFKFVYLTETRFIPSDTILSSASGVGEDVAYQILAFNRWSGIVEGATHYHANYVKPNWSRVYKLIAKIDDHIFYRSE